MAIPFVQAMLLSLEDKSPVQQPETEIGAPSKASSSLPILLKEFAVFKATLNFIVWDLQWSKLECDSQIF